MAESTDAVGFAPRRIAPMARRAAPRAFPKLDK